MNASEFGKLPKSVTTSYGEIAYVEKGEGPVALFVHGVLLNGYLWRDAIENLSDTRRCIAVDILGHGQTKTPAGADMSFGAQAGMLAAFIDALGIDQVDLVANDSGGGISQIFAANNPGRIRSLVLTNCDTHDNYPPKALDALFGIVKAGGLGAFGKQMLENGDVARGAFAVAYEDAAFLSDDLIHTYLEPLMADEESVQNLTNFLLQNEDNSQNVRIEPKLRELQAPALILWGTDDIFFDVKWAHWLGERLPNSRVVEAPGARLFFPEERPGYFASEVRAFWEGVDSGAASRASAVA